MSTGGALLTIHDLSASIHLQPAYVVIKTPVSFLELQGVVHERPAALTDLPLPAIKNFVISFSPSGERDRSVLRSLLDGLQDGSTIVTFEGLILPLSQPPRTTPTPPPPPQRRQIDVRPHVSTSHARFDWSAHQPRQPVLSE